MFFDQDADEAFERAKRCPVQHERTVLGTISADKAGVQTLGQVGVNLQGAALPVPADCVGQGKLKLWTIEGTFAGCNGAVSPGGELGAGGNGVDACFGDSGGPLYLLSDRGDYVVGVTSRAYAGVPWNYPCRDGGIYTRPDAVVDWIESKVGPITKPVCTPT